MLTVACVEWGNYLGRGAEYIEKLAAGVARHLAQPHHFEVVRPEEGPAHPALAAIGPRRAAAGTWPKLQMFRPGRFAGRVLYLDLDTVVVGPLDELVRHVGAVHLADWGWPRNVHAGGCLVWDAGGGVDERIWTSFRPEIAAQFENDQEWMTTLGVWARLPPALVRSYRYHCKSGPPPGASVVCFHGKDKPHLVTEGWVPRHWG